MPPLPSANNNNDDVDDAARCVNPTSDDDSPPALLQEEEEDGIIGGDCIIVLRRAEKRPYLRVFVFLAPRLVGRCPTVQSADDARNTLSLSSQQQTMFKITAVWLYGESRGRAANISSDGGQEC